MLSEKHAVKLFGKRLSSAFFAVCLYSCSRILVQSMVQIIKKKLFSYLLVLGTSFLEFAFSLISSRDHCQRFSPSRISDTPRAGFELAQNMSSGLIEWSCAVVITITQQRHIMNAWFWFNNYQHRSHYPALLCISRDWRAVSVTPSTTILHSLSYGMECHLRPYWPLRWVFIN